MPLLGASSGLTIGWVWIVIGAVVAVVAVVMVARSWRDAHKAVNKREPVVPEQDDAPRWTMPPDA